MNDKEIEVLTMWTKENGVGAFVPAVFLDYSTGDWTDKSEMTDVEIIDGAPMIVRGYVDDATLAQIESNATYLVAWKELRGRLTDAHLDRLMSETDVQKLGDFLRDITGLTNTEIAALFNRTPAQIQAFLLTKTRAEVVSLLKAKWRRLEQ